MLVSTSAATLVELLARPASPRLPVRDTQAFSVSRSLTTSRLIETCKALLERETFSGTDRRDPKLIARHAPLVLRHDLLQRLPHMRRQLVAAMTAERIAQRLLLIAARAIPSSGQTLDLWLRHHLSPPSLVCSTARSTISRTKKRPAEAGL